MFKVKHIGVCDGEAVYIRIILEEIGQKQPPTPLQTNNSMAEAVINGKVQQNKQKPWICNSIGYGIKNVNSSSKYTGGQENRIMRIIGQTPCKFLTPHIILEMLRIEQQIYAARAALNTMMDTWQVHQKPSFCQS
jgi:hypothetical protein